MFQRNVPAPLETLVPGPYASEDGDPLVDAHGHALPPTNPANAAAAAAGHGHDSHGHGHGHGHDAHASHGHGAAKATSAAHDQAPAWAPPAGLVGPAPAVVAFTKQ